MGQARIGIARSDPQATMAVPVETIHLSGKLAPKTKLDPFVRISELVVEYEVVEIIVGSPVSLSGKSGPAAQLAQEFANKLADEVGTTTVRLVDERFSTVQAQRNLNEVGISTRQARSKIDQAAAVIILEQALELESRIGTPPGTKIGSHE